MKLVNQKVGRRRDVKFQTAVQQKMSYKHIPYFFLICAHLWLLLLAFTSNNLSLSLIMCEVAQFSV